MYFYHEQVVIWWLLLRTIHFNLLVNIHSILHLSVCWGPGVTRDLVKWSRSLEPFTFAVAEAHTGEKLPMATRHLYPLQPSFLLRKPHTCVVRLSVQCHRSENDWANVKVRCIWLQGTSLTACYLWCFLKLFTFSFNL